MNLLNPMRLLLAPVLAVTLSFGAMAVALASPGSSEAAGSVNVPVTGTITGIGTFTGIYTITKFVNQGGQLVAQGTLTGTLTNTVGTVLGTVTNVPVNIPVTSPTGSCQVLDLTLGPLDLNLLGLVVHLDQVHLNITAQQGPGNLLGNLLCAVAHLLDSNASTAGLARLLTNLLAAL